MLNKDLNWKEIQEEYSRCGRVRIQNILHEDLAREIHQYLTSDIEYKLDQCGKDAVEPELSDSLSIRSVDEQEEYTRSLDHKGYGYKFYMYHIPDGEQSIIFQLREFLASQPFRGFIYYVTGERVHLVSAMPTCFKSSCFLSRHTDHDQERDYAELKQDETRYFAHVFGFTPYWEADWGGALNFLDEDGVVTDVHTPAFNTLTLFKVPQDHFVSQVATYARANRYSITGWLFGRKSRRRG